MKPDHETAVYFRDQFREARSIALRDAEGFQEILFTLERFGSYLTGKIQDLKQYEIQIRDVALESPLAVYVPTHHQSWHLAFSKLYELVREARNDALHQGAFARHLTNHATQLALILEDALMKELTTTARDYMVREPVRASFWQPLSFIRQQMLVNSFTYLPVQSTESPLNWLFVSDYLIAEYLRRDDRRKERLARTLKDAVEDGLVPEQASTCCPDTPISEVLGISKGKPVLVVEKGQSDRLLGIVTPFDLL
jgi:CBS domain-containing protein